jgi:tetratricopeptide (TPR) repeat protein
LAIARKLRLIPEERDQLLLAAGFRPDKAEATTSTSEAAGAQESEGAVEIERQPRKDEAETAIPLTRRTLKRGQRRLLVGSVGLLILLGVAGWWFSQRQPEEVKDAFTAAPIAGLYTLLENGANRTIAPAAPGETLVLVTHFANYAGSQVGYNVAGRLAQALQREIEHTRVENIRLAIWPDVVETRAQALQIGQAVSATLVIYGEYDVGRVMVEFAHPTDQNVFADPAVQQYVTGVPELSATINTDLPQQVRSLALIALGQIYLTRQDADLARPLLEQARENLQNDPKADEKTWGLVNFYLGLALHKSHPPDLDGAITGYTEAIEAWPAMLSSRLNRSAAYAARGQPDDWAQAVADMDAIIEAKPDWPLAYSNRASIRLNVGGDENLALAQADLDQALALDPNLPGAYLNRAYLAYRQDRPMTELLPDLEKTLTLRPDDTSALNLFCWGYAVEQQPEKAMPYCQRAVELDPEPVFRDSRGVAYVLLGNYEAAIADFEVFVAWLATQPNPAWQQPLARRQTWLATLKSGQNPLTPEVLGDIRHEYGR